MLDILKQKLTSWTPTSASAIYGDTKRVADEFFTNAMWETTPTGVFLISPDLTVFHDFNGDSYYLTLGDKTSSLVQKQAMSDYAEQHDLTRIEKPIDIQLTDIYGVAYTYSRERRPYGTQGLPVEAMLLVSETELVNTVVSVFKLWMASIDDLLKTIQNIPDAMYTTGISKDFFCYDPVTEKFFWAGPMYFGKTQEEFTADAKANNQANMLDTFFQQRYQVTGSIQAEIYNFVATECSTLHQLT